MKTLAVIPARGGSKGIPRKNIRPLAGRPLITYTIDAARKAETVSRVAVSTDDHRIADVATESGAEVVWRPAEISGDHVASEPALLHVLDSLEEKERYVPDVIVFLQCTSPLTTPEDIDGSVRLLVSDQADSVLTVTPFHYFLWGRAPTGEVIGINHPVYKRPLRQEREPEYLETGALYVMRVNGFREHRYRFFGKTSFYEVPQERCFEIDELQDLHVAEAMITTHAKQLTQALLPRPVSAVVMDFDGVLTNNKVAVLEDGREAVVCDRSDGFGLARLRKQGIPLLVLSAETNNVVTERCRKLQIECRQGVKDKQACLEDWCSSMGIAPEHVVYVGNDENDVACLKRVGFGAVPADAQECAKRAAQLVLTRRGGDCAVRELCDLIVASVESHEGDDERGTTA